MTRELKIRDIKIKTLDEKLKEMENKHIEEMKKINQIFSQKEIQKQKIENNLRSKILKLEMEGKEK